mmetsp:Transcript_5655/g.7925  ORF Transcript_5655/g.7925 Transcript_5655/m.7925 type:complete len:283 (-) Transcript_5655:242-1090(-)|eukprot:CAMPEP_0194031068 /NCGR_PEP_ID=MMETSP0009_2-20130614/4340_1 /TAXON_ID=210454 /ORGANISM="Grammatophora oceanica, Strain CCMP 410" /LENGTH=282 /DNA_ID=CAMNT_0038671133 /DNA_START=64 /DNA_END=912 /DNA_ORIENTATION=+
MSSSSSISPPASSPHIGVSGRAFVVTGGSQGLGLEISRVLKKNGAAGLVLVSRSQSKGDAACNELNGDGCACYWLGADLSDAEQTSSVIPKAVELLGSDLVLSGVVNAAAVTARGNLKTTTAEDFDFQMAVNARAPFLVTQAAAANMPNGGSIVNICSVAAHGGAPFIMAYSAAKAALVALTKNNAAELAPAKIRVNAVNMGWTYTENEDKLQQTEHPDGAGWLKAADSGVPLGRILRPCDVAATVAFLLSDASAMMTGSIIELHPEYADGMLSCSAVAGDR